jgi:hypothetical protein
MTKMFFCADMLHHICLLFMLMGWDYVSEPWPSSPRWYMNMNRWNDTVRKTEASTVTKHQVWSTDYRIKISSLKKLEAFWNHMSVKQ